MTENTTIRLRYEKTGRIRFVSHLDDVRLWERAMRRARLPLAFSQGFSPRPLMRFGPALPTTFASSAEYIDVELAEEIIPEDLATRLAAVLPEGYGVLCAEALPGKGESLQAAIVAAEYAVVVEDVSGRFPSGFEAEVVHALESDALPVTIRRKGEEKVVDLRPAVLDARVVPAGGAGADVLAAARAVTTALPRDLPHHWLWCRLASQPRSARPTEFLSVLPSEPRARLVHRSAQLVRDEAGSFAEPIDLSLSQESCDGQIRTQTQGSEEARQHAHAAASEAG